MDHLGVICYILYLCYVSLTFGSEIQTPLIPNDESNLKPYQIAIIGAGAGGASAAYYLRRFSQLSASNIPLNVTIIEANSRIGGRTTTVNALGDTRYPTELGGSIFVRINHILYNATRDFGLEIKTKHYESSQDSNFDLGIWDGSQFVFKQSSDEDSRWKGWWDIAKLLWKYGMSPIRTQRITKSTVGRFLRFYNEPIFPFNTLQEAVEKTGLLDFTSTTGQDTLRAAGVGDLFSQEIIQASTRVNYAQNINSIHGLEALVCMAIEGAMAVEGGNWQIFDQAVKRSHAMLKFNTTVTNVKETDKGTYELDIDSASIDLDFEPFDSVILAAPYQFANLSFTPALQNPPKKVPYVSLHVTLLASPHLLSARFFNADSQSEVPSTILTTLPQTQNLTNIHPSSEEQYSNVAVGPTKFWSISTLRILRPDSDVATSPQYLYKIFSPMPITGSFLSSLLGFTYQNTTSEDPISSISKSDISWSHEKVWNSYPYEIPRSEFEDNIRLSQKKGEEGNGKDKGPEGIWYTSGIESFISTMETSALSGMNVARLIIDGLEKKYAMDTDQDQGPS